jgi:S-adenosylmethionine:tRNA ribosyltransferase-isomerase
MLVSKFRFDLPPELIAQQPLPSRSSSRLLCLDGDTGELKDRLFSDFLDLVKDDDLLVFNDTKVIPARLYGRKESGGKVEILVERLLSSYMVLAHIKASRAPKAGSNLYIDDKLIRVLERKGSLFKLESDSLPFPQIMELLGHTPLPPYIDRADTQADAQRYQTVYAEQPGAVAAPTAGLHFDKNSMMEIEKRGIHLAMVTLHVGAGTFQPIRVEDTDDHEMHSEWLQLSEEVCRKVEQTRKRRGRVIAIGTTSVRCLESAALSGRLEPYEGETRLFITPGFKFKVVDAMLTNFHLPESTLLMLVCTFAGYENVLSAYKHAIDERYRFFSYGDAMFIQGKKKARLKEPRQVPPKEDGGVY